jgi:hypothetical protein
MRAGLRNYVRKGYAGKNGAARRFGGTARTAGALYNSLAPATERRPGEPGGQLDHTLLQGRSAKEIVTAVIDAVRPVDGTQDAEAARMALGDALAEVLEQFPDADLLNLSDEQRDFLIERYAAEDVFRRFQLDIGGAVLARAPNATIGVQRLKQIRDYIREVIAASFRKLRRAGAAFTSSTIARTVYGALSDAMEVFELNAT